MALMIILVHSSIWTSFTSYKEEEEENQSRSTKRRRERVKEVIQTSTMSENFIFASWLARLPWNVLLIPNTLEMTLLVLSWVESESSVIWKTGAMTPPASFWTASGTDLTSLSPEGGMETPAIEFAAARSIVAAHLRR